MDRGIVLQDYLLGGFLPAEPGLSHVFFWRWGGGDGTLPKSLFENDIKN